MKKPVHVAVVGGSGSGKTWLAEKLVEAFGPQATRLSLDDFYRDWSHLEKKVRDAVNFDDPAAIDWETFRGVMETMRIGEKLALPVYDFATHARLAEARSFSPPPLVIWDGLWLLHHDWALENFALSLFVECDVRERFRRRAERDVRERGRTQESVRRQFFEQVEPMHEKYVEPQRARSRQILCSPISPADCNRLIQNILATQPDLQKTGRPK